MADDIIQKITNPHYEYVPDLYSKSGYIIIGETDECAVVNCFGERRITPKDAIARYEECDTPVVRIFIGGNVSSLILLAQEWNKKPIDEAIGALESELLR